MAAVRSAESSLNIHGLDAARSTVPLLCLPRQDVGQVTGNWGRVQERVTAVARSVPEPGADRLATDGTAGCLAITWPYAPPHLGIGSTEEVLATFSGGVADRHPPTGPTTDAAGVDHPGKEGVRLLTWGDPYLTAWLETVRGEPLSEADYQAAGVGRGANPLR